MHTSSGRVTRVAMGLTVAMVLSCSGRESSPKPTPKLTLPLAKGGQPQCTADSPVVTIDPQFVRFEGDPLRPTVLLASEAKVDRFEPLIDKLVEFKRNWAAQHPTEFFVLSVVIEADESTDHRVTRKIVHAAHQGGYTSMCFAARGADSARLFFKLRHPDPPPEDLSKLPASAFVVIMPEGYCVGSGQLAPEGSPDPGDVAHLREGLAKWRADNPTRTDVTIAADDGTTYAQLVTAISTVAESGMDDIMVSSF